MTWEPFDTAPVDGTMIDIWFDHGDGDGYRIPDCWYACERESGMAPDCKVPSWVSLSMTDQCKEMLDLPTQYATHWMLRPGAPK